MRSKPANRTEHQDARSIDDAFISHAPPREGTVRDAGKSVAHRMRAILRARKPGKRATRSRAATTVERLESLVMMDASGAFGEALYGPVEAPETETSADYMTEEELSMMAEEVYRAETEQEMPSGEDASDSSSADAYAYEMEMADAPTHEESADSGMEDMTDDMASYADGTASSIMEESSADMVTDDAAAMTALPPAILHVDVSVEAGDGAETPSFYGPAPADDDVIHMHNDAIEVPRGIDAAFWGAHASHTPPEAIASLAPGFTVQDMALSPDGQTMALSTRDGAVHLYSTETGSQFKTLRGHAGIVTKVVFSPNGEHIASTAYDRTVRIWDLRSGRTVSSFDLPNLGVGLEYSPDGSRIAVGVHEQATQVIDLATGAVQNVEMPGRIFVTRFRFTPDGTQLAHAFGKSVVLYDLASASITRRYNGLSDDVQALDIDPSGTYLAAGDNAGKTAIWRVDSARRIILQQKHTGRPVAANGLRAVQFDPYRRLITADYDGTVIVQDVSGLTDNEEPVEIARHQGPREPGSLATHSGQRFIMNTAHNQETSRVIVYDLPDLPPGAPWAPLQNATSLREKLPSILSQDRDIEEPMHPDISVVKLNGLNILAAFNTPVRKSVVTIGPRGVLSRQHLTHVGGTEFNMAFGTFDRTLMSGTYQITLWDGESNEILGAVGLKWNHQTGVLTLANGEQDMLQNTDEVDTGTFDAIMSMNSAYLGDEQINRIQRARLYELTGEIDPAYNLMISNNDVEERILQRYPVFHPDNWHAEIMRMWREEYPGFESGRVEDFFHNHRLGVYRTMREGLERYEQAVSEMMQIAVDGLVQIRKGMDANEMERNLNEAFDRWVNPVLKIYQTQARELANLQSLGIYLPSRTRIIEAARQVLDIAWQEMIRRQQDVIDYREYARKQVDSGMYLNARNQWVAISKESPSSLPPQMSRKQVAFASKLLRLFNTSNDPRITALRAIGRTTLSLHAANSIDDLAPSDAQLNQVLLALADADNPEVIGGVRVDMPNVWESARNHVTQLDEAAVFEEMRALYSDNGDPHLTIGGITVKATTVASRMALGFYQNAVALREDQHALARLCVKMEQVTGIAANHLYGLVRFYKHETFARRLIERFEASGYYIREGNPGPVSLDRGLRPTVEYRDTVIRIHIDVPAFGADLLHFQVNLVNIYNWINIIENVEPYTSNRLYVDIPAAVMRGRSKEVGIKAIGWLNGKTEPVWGISAGIDATKLNVGEGPVDTRGFVGETWDNLTDQQKSQLGAALDFSYTSSLPKNKQVIDWLMANYLDPSSNKFRFDPNNMEWIGSRYDNIIYDENGMPKLDSNGNIIRNLLIGECKWWVDQVIEQEMRLAIIPPLRQAIDEFGNLGPSYEWIEHDHVKMLHQSMKVGELDNFLGEGNVSSGDMIQYTKDNYQHTVIIGAIVESGAWVFDSNYQLDDTPRYHFLSNNYLNTIEKFTIYRLRNES